MEYLLKEEKLLQSANICEEILRLNKNDNLGARYLLIIYATLEEEKEILNLYKKYPEENIEMLFPLFTIYYKSGKIKKLRNI